MKDDLERETSVETSPKFQPKFQALSFSCETSLPYLSLQMMQFIHWTTRPEWRVRFPCAEICCPRITTTMLVARSGHEMKWVCSILPQKARRLQVSFLLAMACFRRTEPPGVGATLALCSSHTKRHANTSNKGHPCQKENNHFGFSSR